MRTRVPSEGHVLVFVAALSASDGGPPEVVRSLAETRAAEGLRTVILTTDADGRHKRVPRQLLLPSSPLTEIVVHRVHRPRRFKTALGMVPSAWRYSRGACAVHVHGLYLFSSVVGALIAKIRGLRLVIQPHGVLQPWAQRRSRHLKRAFDRVIGDWILKSADVTICASKAEADAAGHRLPGNVMVIPHGVMCSPCDHPSLQANRRHREIVVLFLGRLSDVKNPDILIRAWSESLRDRDARLVLAGPDETFTAAQLAALAEELGCGDSAALVGRVSGEAKHCLLERADIVAVPSASESFSLVVAEGMSHGCAVLTSVGVGLADEVNLAGAGVVLHSVSVPSVTAGLNRLMQDGDELRSMQTAARAYAAGRFDWGQIANLYEKAYLA